MSFDIPTSQVTEGRFRFEIGLAAASAPAYVALGLSFDDEMGEDSVMACTLFGDSVDVAMYWNVASPYNSLPLANAHFGLAEVAGGVVQGRDALGELVGLPEHRHEDAGRPEVGRHVDGRDRGEADVGVAQLLAQQASTAVPMVAIPSVSSGSNCRYTLPSKAAENATHSGTSSVYQAGESDDAVGNAVAADAPHAAAAVSPPPPRQQQIASHASAPAATTQHCGSTALAFAIKHKAYPTPIFIPRTHPPTPHRWCSHTS